MTMTLSLNLPKKKESEKLHFFILGWLSTNLALFSAIQNTATKGGLISESSLLWLKSPKMGAISLARALTVQLKRGEREKIWHAFLEF